VVNDGADNVWRELYDQMAELYALAPWRWMADSDLFAVRNPDDGQIGYVSVFGAGGESFGVFVFLGAYGLWTYQRQAEIGASGDIGRMDPSEVLEQLPYGLSALFEDRASLSEAERRRLRALGRSYRGRNAWPQARFHEPGYVPTVDLLPAQARLLATAVDQTLEVARRVNDDPRYLVPPASRAGQLRLRTQAPGSERWVDAWHRPPHAARPEPTATLEPAAIVREIGTLAPATGTWEVELAYLPGVVDEGRGSRAYFPRLILVVDGASGLVLASDVRAPDQTAESVQLTVLSTTLQHHPPEILRVRHPDAARLLEPVARAIGARLTVSQRLPQAERARRAIFAAMDGDP
jgi:hypothetical protein